MFLFRRRRRVPFAYASGVGMRVFMATTLFVLYAPILSLIAFSFNDSRRNIVWRGFTFDYYVKAWRNESLFEALTNSLLIATAAAIVSLFLGLCLGLALQRFRFPCKNALEGAAALPIVIPEICMGAAMLVFFNRIGWPTDLPWPWNLSSIAIAHVSFCFPFAAAILRMRLRSLNPEFEEAARDLGADEWRVFRDIHFPHLKPALIAAGLIAFTLSLDDFVISFFTSGPNAVTFPVKIYSMVRFSITPEINAASTALIAITLIVVVAAFAIQGRLENDRDRMGRPRRPGVAGSDRRGGGAAS